MAVAYDFTEGQVALMRDGSKGHDELAELFGCSNMPIRRWRKKHAVKLTKPLGGSLSSVTADTDDELALLKHENADLRRIVRKASRTDLGDERVLRAIEHAIERVRPSTPPTTRLSTSKALRGNQDAHHRQIALFSDWHYGEHVDAESVSDINAYSVAICEDRVAQLVRSILSFKRVRPALTGLDIFILGDMATGRIHRLEETNEVPAQEQYVRVGYLIAWAVGELAPHYPEINVHCTWGNHPRDTPDPSTSHSNGDWVACQLAKAATGHLPNVTWNIPKAGMVVATVADLNFLVWHGDGIRSNSAGVPWMAMSKRAALLRETYADAGTRLNYLVVGHYHQQAAVPGMFMNGSLIGANAHGMKNYGGGMKPCQLLLTLDERKQRLVDTAYCTPS